MERPCERAGEETRARQAQLPTRAPARARPCREQVSLPVPGSAGLRRSISAIVTNLSALSSQARRLSGDAPGHTPSGDKVKGERRGEGGAASCPSAEEGGLSAAISTSAPLGGPRTAALLLPSLPALPVRLGREVAGGSENVPNTQGQGPGPIGRARASRSLGAGSCVHVGRAGTSLSPHLWENPRLGEGGAGTSIRAQGYPIPQLASDSRQDETNCSFRKPT